MQGKRVLDRRRAASQRSKFQIRSDAFASGAVVRCVLTEGGKQFVTPIELGALSEDKVYDDLILADRRNEMGHIKLSREADVVHGRPCQRRHLGKYGCRAGRTIWRHRLTGDRQAGICVPSMNVRMWEHRRPRRMSKPLKHAA